MLEKTFKAGFLIPLLLSTSCTLSVAAPSSTSYDANPKTRAFINEMVTRHNLNREELNRLFREAKRREDILELMRKPAEKKLEWHEYRKIFLTRSRIEGGVAFWKENIDLLDRAAAKFGVPPEIIVAIIGVETRYGKNTGRHRVLDALSTLAFDYPPRSKFFRKELEQYLLLSREEDIDSLSTKGSYAGAMGYGQFIPSSYRAYTVDFDGDGKRDLWNSRADIIGSVANYFHAHKWQPGGPIATPATVSGDKFPAIARLGYKPSIRLDKMRRDGILPVKPVPDSLLGSLLTFKQQDGPEYWIGFKNFYVITRYNHSPLYAMAVYQLSERIRDAYEQNQQDFHD